MLNKYNASKSIRHLEKDENICWAYENNNHKNAEIKNFADNKKFETFNVHYL